MEIEKDKINYRRANINDIEFLVDYMGDLNLEDLDIFSIYIQSPKQEEKAFALDC